MADDSSPKADRMEIPVNLSTAPKFSLSLGAKKSSTSTPLRSKRPHAVLEEDLVEPEQVTLEEISSFDRDVAKPVKLQRVIQSIPDVDWKHASERKRQKSGIPASTRTHDSATRDTEAKIDENLPAYGLTVVERPSRALSETTPPAEGATTNTTQRRSKTADEEALEALKSDRRAAAKAITPPTEDEAFKDSYDYAPPAPTAQEFAATPVDGFGAAILRGYLKNGRTLEDHGYNEDGKDDAAKRRPGLLGLGAKESGLGVELGAWGKGAKAQKGEGYIPLARKNNKTGEVLTDEELRAKLEAQKIAEKNGTFVNGDTNRGERRRGERDDIDRKRIEYGTSKLSRSERHERDDEREFGRKRDRRRYADEEDGHNKRHGRNEDDGRRRRSRDRDQSRDGDRRRRDGAYGEIDRDHDHRRRRRDRSADAHRHTHSHHSSRR